MMEYAMLLIVARLTAFASSLSDNIGFAIESNEFSARMNTLATGGPNQAVYRNLRYDYGYSPEVQGNRVLSEEYF